MPGASSIVGERPNFPASQPGKKTTTVSCSLCPPSPFPGFRLLVYKLADYSHESYTVTELLPANALSAYENLVLNAWE